METEGIEEHERQQEERDPEARRVVRAMLAGLVMAGELANPSVNASPENRVEGAICLADMLLAELDRTEAHGS